MSERDAQVDRLRKRRPRNRFVRTSVLLLILLVAVSWWAGGFSVDDLLSPRRVQNVERFFSEIVPYPLRETGFDTKVAIQWLWSIWQRRGRQACVTTLAIAVAASVLAGLAASVLALPASRTVASPEPYVPSGKTPSRISRIWWRGIIAVTRALLIFMRSIPEYIWAFLFLSMLGPKAWPAVLALAVHNTGILGRLGGEVIENADRAGPAALRGLGSSRSQIAVVGLFPVVLPRWLLYFFYRWETCVREATVLGLLGFVSLGYWIQDARVRDRYDEMFVMVLLAALIVLAGDVTSAIGRAWIRRAA